MKTNLSRLEPPKILLVAPHADDELIGAGGSLLRWKAEGSRVLIVLVASSNIKHRHTRVVTEGSVREHEFLNSAKLLSTDDPVLLRMEDSKLDCTPLQKLVHELDNILEHWKPDIMLYPEPSYHQDHQYVNRACTAALRPTKRQLPQRILTYEIPTSTWVGSAEPFVPNYYVDIEETLEQKLEIFKSVYVSQSTETERVKLAVQGIRDHSTYRGLECGLKSAEAFRLLQEKV